VEFICKLLRLGPFFALIFTLGCGLQSEGYYVASWSLAMPKESGRSLKGAKELAASGVPLLPPATRDRPVTILRIFLAGPAPSTIALPKPLRVIDVMWGPTGYLFQGSRAGSCVVVQAIGEPSVWPQIEIHADGVNRRETFTLQAQLLSEPLRIYSNGYKPAISNMLLTKGKAPQGLTFRCHLSPEPIQPGMISRLNPNAMFEEQRYSDEGVLLGVAEANFVTSRK